MSDFSFDHYNLVDIFDKYEQITSINYNDLIEMMEYRAQFDKFEYVYETV